MAQLIKLTKKNGDVVYLNADKIISVIPFYEFPPSSPEDADPVGFVAGSTVFHEPYNSGNECDWESVTDTPEEIIDRIRSAGLEQHFLG